MEKSELLFAGLCFDISLIRLCRCLKINTRKESSNYLIKQKIVAHNMTSADHITGKHVLEKLDI